VKTSVENRLGQIRKSRGVGASELARRVHVSRQTIYAIEAGTYVPNTEVALNLARELEVTVDELFSLQVGARKSPESLTAEVLSPAPPAKGQPVRICQIGSRWISVPVSASPYYMPEADGIVKRAARSGGRADLVVFAKDDAAQKRLVLAGCDPATGLLSRMVEKISGVEIVSAAASSKLALTWLKDGKVHIAGSHLEDPKTGEFNLPFLRKEFPGEDLCVVTFARWEEGLVMAAGNPKGVRKVEDLARRSVRFVNRETGSGSRGLLDKLLQNAGMDAQKITGYDRVAYGHLAAAYCVLSRDADVCLATRSAAQTFGLDFLPLHSERYDLVMRRRTADLPAVKSFLDVLQRATLRRKLEVLAGYDTSETGTMIA
jgi:putative molybdopterin biosynthesis protein